MTISEKWSDSKTFEFSWSVAQILAPFEDVVPTLARSHSYKDLKQSWGSKPFRVSDGDLGHTVAYSTSSSSWTFLESSHWQLDYGPLLRISNKLKTDFTFACYCEDPFGLLFAHCKNGRTVEQIVQTDELYFQPETIDGKEQRWQQSSELNILRYGKRESQLSIESAGVEDWWNEVTNSLDLSVPYLCWTDWLSDSEFTVDQSVVPDIVEARLFCA